MKKSDRFNALSPRKLVMRRETVRVLRQLTLHELRDAHGGLTKPDCEDSTLQPWTAMCD
jgi:uncharacterized protein YjiS (DUF1127 family)